MNRIKDELSVFIEYTPNSAEDDYELKVTVNGESTHSLTPFGQSMPDMTLDKILKETKEVIEEELGL